jgi:hypothetical protein
MSAKPNESRTMSTSTSSRSPRSRSGRPGRGGASGADDGPRAKFSQLLPYLAEHKPVLAVVIGLSILAAGASLIQPLLVSQVIARVQAGDTLDNLVWALVALVVISGLLGGFQHYLLQRTGKCCALRPPTVGAPDASPADQRIRHPPHR